MRVCLFVLLVACAASPSALAQSAPASLGYFRFPALTDDGIIFTAEGDLWRVSLRGGKARRLTTHPGEESHASVSPDGRALAYSASYEGPVEVYTMEVDGGVPRRRTFDGGTALVVGWSPAGHLLYSTRRYAGLPGVHLAVLDLDSGQSSRVPLAQASDGSYDADGATLFFTRFPFQGSFTKRYRGGTAQKIWTFSGGTREAEPLTADHDGTSRTPMVWLERVYFVSDRDGTMNVWSMTHAGTDLRQHTRHAGFDVQSPSLRDGRIVYQLGADLRLLDLTTGADAGVPIRLVSDFEHVRERWMRTPSEWVTSARLSPDGDRLVVTARGQVYVLPAQPGRVVAATHSASARYRDARFMPDGRTLLAIGDRSGEFELWTVPADGIGAPSQITSDAMVLRWDGVASPDGRFIAHHDKDLQLWLHDVGSGRDRIITTSTNESVRDLRWSPDSGWLAYAQTGANDVTRIWLYDVREAQAHVVSSERYDSYSPVWSPDGAWLSFLSDRRFESTVASPWGPRQPEPFFDRQTRIYQLALRKGLRWPFAVPDELTPVSADAASLPPVTDVSTPGAAVAVDFDGLRERLYEVPVPAGNYASLETDGQRLYFLAWDASPSPRRALRGVPMDHRRLLPDTMMEDVQRYDLSLDRRKLLVHKGHDFYVFDADGRIPFEPARVRVDLSGWSVQVDPRAEWRQMFMDAWRMKRDDFYDRGMHGVDWTAVRSRYQPLVGRVTDRAELNDLIAQMVGELSALHSFVRGGDLRRGADNVEPASLGATFVRDEAAGGFRVEHVHRGDSELPEHVAPLARPDVGIREGDIIAAVNGVLAVSATDMHALLRNTAGRQVRLRVSPQGQSPTRDVIAVPITMQRDADLRYAEWEHTRRLRVDEATERQVGYLHLRGMGAEHMAEWMRGFYPDYNRAGLIIDLRHNTGGNIDSWILSRLLRQAWFFWQPRAGQPSWNMQYAFRGHMVVLVDQHTASDGEAFAEGFRRLGLGKVIGTRTWGGEIWLSGSSMLVDRGVATAGEVGVYGPEGTWLIEGHGVEPDIVVDNLPHATFMGEDAQLDAAIAHLQELIRQSPVTLPGAPAYPDKTAPVSTTASGVGGGP